MNQFTSMNSTHVKSQNKASILGYVYHNGVCSRTDICNVLGLSKPTVSMLVDELVRENFLKTVGIGKSTTQGGKRPQLYDINAQRGAIIAIFIGVESIQGALVDLKLKMIKHTEIKYKKEETAQSLSDTCMAVSLLQAEAEQLGIDLFGIGVSASGVVEPHTGVLVNAANLGHWNDIPLGAVLKERFHLPVWVDNAARNIALAEKWAGIGKSLSTFVTLQTVGGVGTGIFLEGDIYHGIGNSMGEFGHTSIDFNGPRCLCGNRGCWELYASDSAFLRQVKHALQGNDSNLLANRLKEGKALDFGIISECYLDGDPFVTGQVRQYAFYLGVGIVNLINVFNPERVILQGHLKRLGSSFLTEIEAIVKDRALDSANQYVKLMYSEFKEETKIVGAAALGIKEVLAGKFFV